MLDLVKLATLRSVVEHASFSAAAAALHLTQPAVSRQIALLERQLGTDLVLRTRGGVRPTEAGRVLVAHAEVVLARLERAESDVRRLTGLQQGTVRLGSFFSALVHLSAEVAVVLGAEHPGIVVVDELVDRAAAMQGLSRGTLDLAIVVEDDTEPAAAVPGVTVHPLFDDPVRALLPADHPLAAEDAVRLADLAGTPWIRPHEGAAARRLDRVLAGAGLSPPIVLAGRGDEPVEVQALVAAGRGVTLTHDLTVVVSGQQVVVRPLTGDPGWRRVGAAVLAGPQPPAVAAALDALLRVGAARRQRLGRR